MKLLNRTLIWLSGTLLLALTVWAVIFYVSMLDEVHDSIDDGLDNSRLLIIHEAFRDSTVLSQRRFDEGNYSIRPLAETRALRHTDRYADTLMYMENERDFEPVRLLTTVFQARDGRYYELKVISSMVEEDDLIEDLLFSLLWLYLALVVSILLINNMLLRRIWKPFYNLLDKLKRFRLGRHEQFEPEPTTISEFRQLNDTVMEVLQSNVKAFHNQKELIENASHELQTPLAIALSKLQLFIEQNDLTEEQLENVVQIMQTLERLTRLNRSLLLLSKIENRQFPDVSPVNINALCTSLIGDFLDVAEHRGVTISVEEEGQWIVNMHEDLAVILMTNLIKNALVHNVRGGTLHIRITPSSLTLVNTGKAQALDPAGIFNRFHKETSEQRSSGLGLAIVRSICEASGIGVRYAYDGKHIFELTD